MYGGLLKNKKSTDVLILYTNIWYLPILSRSLTHTLTSFSLTHLLKLTLTHTQVHSHPLVLKLHVQYFLLFNIQITYYSNLHSIFVSYTQLIKSKLTYSTVVLQYITTCIHRTVPTKLTVVQYYILLYIHTIPIVQYWLPV